MRVRYTEKTKLRRKIFTEIARLTYENGGPEMLDELIEIGRASCRERV